jgi:hypothetical protein
MRNIALVLLLTFELMTLGKVAAAKEFDLPDVINGTPPPEFVKRWTRLSILGPRNSPYPIVWLSPYSFGRSGFEKLIVLSPRAYKTTEFLSRSNLCTNGIKKYPKSGTLEVATFSQRKQALCTMPRKQACYSLSKLLMLPGMEQTTPKAEPIRELMAAVNCAQK